MSYGGKKSDLRGQKLARGQKVGEIAGNAATWSSKLGRRLLILCSLQSQGHTEMETGDV